MWRLWTRGWGPRAWWYWFRTEGFPMWVAWRLPHRVALWAFIRVYAKDGQAPGPDYERVYKAWEGVNPKLSTPDPVPANKATTGLYRKFDVRRTDGTDQPGGKHEDCRYFVLDLTHDPHAIPAIRAYAKSCRKLYPALASDLLLIADGSQLTAEKAVRHD